MKGLGIGIALSFICQISGNFLIISYSVLIFAKAGTTIDPYVSSIYSAVALIFGSILSTYLADILGRKILNLISLMGSAIGFFSMALHYYLHINGYDLTEFQWVPVVSVSFVIFITSAGIASLQIVCSIEYLPAKVFLPCLFRFKFTNFYLLLQIYEPMNYYFHPWIIIFYRFERLVRQ